MDRIFQYVRFYQQVEIADEIIDIRVEPYKPKNINIERNAKGFILSGYFGEDIFTEDAFKIEVDGVVNTYTSFHSIPAVIDHVIEFTPDHEHDRDYVFIITTTSGVQTMTINCHHYVEPWEDKLVELIKRERYASSV